MKTRTRTFPSDMLSVEHNGQRIVVFTHRQEIVVTVAPEGCCGRDWRFSFEQFRDLFMNLKEPQNQ